ncbi:MAG: aminotransferase class I/II-fold pyridoxal phosphate-dependent enzyme, partial [Actinobacteria bacterium]|nr:aminotransferase class I/II-fold pyridoxal phosphate-dependent enzyme [Actinomycetota bacterium]
VALEALNIMEVEPQHRERLQQNATRLRQGLSALGFDTLGSETQIVPVLIGPDELTVVFWKELWEAGIFTTPALPPGVPHGQSIIRTSVNANHTPEQIGRLLKSFARVGRGLGVIG